MINRLLVAALLAAGCSSAELLPEQVRVRTGPAAHRSPRKVVALPATCAGLSTRQIWDPATGSYQGTTADSGFTSNCGATELAGVDQTVRAALEFGGLEIIDSEQLNAITFERVETMESSRTTSPGQVARESSTRDVARRGATFAEAPPSLQRQILRDLAADGVINTRIWLGPIRGVSMRRDIQVQVRLVHLPSGQLVWARRCSLEVSMDSDARAMERAARCAAEEESPP